MSRFGFWGPHAIFCLMAIVYESAQVLSLNLFTDSLLPLTPTDSFDCCEVCRQSIVAQSFSDAFAPSYVQVVQCMECLLGPLVIIHVEYAVEVHESFLVYTLACIECS